jgi:hypothetical protein
MLRIGTRGRLFCTRSCTYGSLEMWIISCFAESLLSSEGNGFKVLIIC